MKQMSSKIILDAQPCNLLKTMSSNVVQSIRAFTVDSLKQASMQIDHHFLYVNLAGAKNKQDILDQVIKQLDLNVPESLQQQQCKHKHRQKNLNGLYSCITDVIYKSGLHSGFILMVDNIPCDTTFDTDLREQLIDTLRDVADYWSERKIAFRCFYSFAVACRRSKAVASHINNQRTSKSLLNENCNQLEAIDIHENVAICDAEALELSNGELLNISARALRMSSPFNSAYWLNSAN